MSDFFDEMFAEFDERAAVRAVEKAEAEAERARAKAQSKRQILDAYRAWAAAQGGVRTDADIEATNLNRLPGAVSGRAASPTGRHAIMSAIAVGGSGREWTIPTIAEALGLGEEAHRRLGVTLQRLVNDGALVRPRKGFYKLPPATAGPGAGEGREADSENGSQNGSGEAVDSSELFGLAGPAPR